ncbi:MAG TPA: hypothetical protein VIV60_20145 [Polyangiaceae bacterium]
MTFPDERQALLLWTMLTAETAELRNPFKSKIQPDIGTAKRDALIQKGFLELLPQGHGVRLCLTDKAWAWAAAEVDVKLMQPAAGVGVRALQGLLRRLLPFLQSRDIPLSDLFRETGEDLQTVAPPVQRRREADVLAASKVRAKPSQSHAKRSVTNGGRNDRVVDEANRAMATNAEETSIECAQQSLVGQLEQVCRVLNGQRPAGPIRLTTLRAQLSHLPRAVLDAELSRLHESGKLVLYRDDNSAALTRDDERDALIVGGSPRHLLYWRE